VSAAALAELASSATLAVPAYDWVFGCSAVSGTMIAAYFDRNGLPDIYTGPTGGGVMPLDNSVWGSWTDGARETYPNNPLTATHNGVDGRTIRGSIDDYWVSYLSNSADPYVGQWAEHAWGEAIGDYMKTSQSAYGNVDGSTSFYNWTSSGTPLTCADMVTYDIDTVDGTYGRKQFYEARGYEVGDCFNQKTDNNNGGFTFASYKAKIDAGYPVFLNLEGHSIVGVGYADPSTVYIHDTWDYATHTMTWGGSYAGMTLQSVSVVDPVLGAGRPAISINNVSVPEGNAGTEDAIFTVSLSIPAPAPVSVSWATANGTAAAGSDYVAGSGVVSFATGESTQTVTVPVKGDAAYESDETFYVNLSNASGATIADAQGTGTIVNDDPQPLPSTHVGDLDGSRSIQKKTNTWTATVTITVHDANEKVVSGAAVSGVWSDGSAPSCTTSRRGTCTITKSGIPASTTSVTWTVTGVVKSGYEYQPGANHDVDGTGDSNGTTIEIRK
jgi:hypothetical protein